VFADNKEYTVRRFDGNGSIIMPPPPEIGLPWVGTWEVLDEPKAKTVWVRGVEG